jgi:hypothetical protein
MGRRGRAVPDLMLTDAQRTTLMQWTRRGTTAHAVLMRARVVLACAEGHTNGVIADTERVTRPTVRRCRQRSVDRHTDDLLDEPKPDAPHRRRHGRVGLEAHAGNAPADVRSVLAIVGGQDGNPG